MRTNPFYDAYEFMIGASGFHQQAGAQGYVMVVLFWGLLIASFYIAWRNWQEDPDQRTIEHAATWFFRVMIGAMWFEGSVWKMPLPLSGGFAHWVNEIGTHAAFGFHSQIAKNVYTPLLIVINPLVFLTELALAASFMLGFAVRLFGLIGMAFALHLFFGLYRHPAEWPWLFLFLTFAQGFFVIHAAGRSLGLDALLRRRRAGSTDEAPRLSPLYARLS